MRYAARLFALVIATLLGCVLLFDLYFLRDSYLDNGHHLPPWMGMQDFIGIGMVVLAFLLFCLLFKFFGGKPGRAKHAIALVIGLLALALAFVSYRYRLQIATKVWHWRHGNVVVLARYEIPIPHQWIVRNRDPRSVELSDVATGSMVFINVPNLSPGHSHFDLNFWASFMKQHPLPGGMRLDVQLSLKMGDETVVCLGNKPTEPGLPPTGISGFRCASSRGLSLRFLGPRADVQQFDAIVRGIRRK